MAYYTRPVLAMATILATLGAALLTARAQTLPPTSTSSGPPRLVGCAPPSNTPAYVLQDPHFQAQQYLFSKRTYPTCKVPSGGLQAAIAQLHGVPPSPQQSWLPVAPRTSPAPANPTLPDGLGETPWSTIGPVSINTGYYGIATGHVEAIAVDPTSPSTMYIGADTGGVWKTTDAGAHWSPPASTEVTPSIGALAIDPNNHNTVYAGTGYGIYEIDGNGLLRSTDGGGTWTSVGTSSTFGWWTGFHKIVVDPSNSSRIWAATTGGLYLTTDGGATWNKLSGVPQMDIWDMALDPANQNVIYATAGANFASNSQAGIYKSSDGGTTWSLLSNGPNGNTTTPGGSTHVGLIRLAIAGTSGALTIYATVEDPTNTTLYGAFKSTDGGSSWTTLANPDPPSATGAGTQYWYDDVLAVDPSDSSGQTVWVGGINIFKTANGGSTWTRVTDVYGTNAQHLHPDQHAFAFSGATIYVGNDGGVYSSSDGGATWPDHNSTLDITQFYSGAADPSYAPKVIGGAQDNGTNLWAGAYSNLQWREIFGGDGGDTAVDYTSPQTYYEEYINLRMSKSTDGGTTWNSITNGITDLNHACFIAPFRMDPSSAQHLIAGTSEVYQTTNGGTGWSPISGDLTGGSGCVTALAIAPSAPSTTFYASTSSGKVWVTTNAGTSWTDISTGLPNFWKSSLAVDPSNPQIAYITGGWCISNGCVWRTTNAGGSWQNISGNLPNFNVNTIVVDPLDSSHLYIGTDLGAFETTDLGSSWTALNAGMPGVAIDELELNRNGTILTAATYGRGMYQLFRSWLVLNPSSGLPGSSAAATGYGFQAGEAVTTSFNGTVLSTQTADSKGTVNATFAVPSLSPGTYTVQMAGNTSGRTAKHSFTVRPQPGKLVVTTAGDATSCPNGPGSPGYSLRCAILQANADGAGDTIVFSIPSSDPGCQQATISGKSVAVCTITPTTDLPQLTASNTTIDGYTQPGASPNTNPFYSGDNAILTVRIDGATGVGGLVLNGNASNDIVRGLEVTRFSPPYGLLLMNSGVANNTIAGNFFGTDGTNALGNSVGIYVAGGSSGNLIGGTSSDAANLISSNANDGVLIGLGSKNRVEGNYIGTDATGAKPLANGTLASPPQRAGNAAVVPLSASGLPNGAGVYLFAGASSNTIGVTGAGNMIAHNTYGVAATGSSANTIAGNTITGGYIGALLYGAENGDTVYKDVIQNNSNDGVDVGTSSTDSTHVSISQNSISGNGSLGIDFGLAAPATICSGPTSGAPDDYTPCPGIQSATTSRVSGAACAGCTVEVYVATNEADDQGHGEGQSFLGSTTADAAGAWGLAVSAGQVSSGQSVTATATTQPTASTAAETSEFALNVAVGAGSCSGTATIQAGAGWNMVGGCSSAPWPDATAIWAYNAATRTYNQPSANSPIGAGFWETVPAAGARTVAVETCGGPVTVTVAPHWWNLVGNPCSSAVAVSGASRLWWYDPAKGKYTTVTSIGAGAAAWMVPTGTTVTLNPVASATTALRLNRHTKEHWAPPVQWARPLRSSDGYPPPSPPYLTIKGETHHGIPRADPSIYPF